MIPSYKEEVKITVIESSRELSLEQQVKELQEQVRILKESIDYINREKSRLKSDIDLLKQSARRQ
jgi:predicted RNase H-like nuclease (RuvC/YqgF family)